MWLCAIWAGALPPILYRRIRRLSRGLVKVVFFGVLDFVVVPRVAEAELFDLLLSLGAILGGREAERAAGCGHGIICVEHSVMNAAKRAIWGDVIKVEQRIQCALSA